MTNFPITRLRQDRAKTLARILNNDTPQERIPTALEQAVFDRAQEAQVDGYVVVYQMDAVTKEFTGFSRIRKPD